LKTAWPTGLKPCAPPFASTSSTAADVIKTCATGGVLSLRDDVGLRRNVTQAELDALVDEAHALRRKTAAHAHGRTGAPKRAIARAIDSIEHGSSSTTKRWT